MSPVLGIDLGTTNSAMAIVNEFGRPEILTNREGQRVTPSVVMFDGDDPVVGEIARQSAALRPLDTVQFVKRQMGERSWSFRSEAGHSYSAEDISAIILKRLKVDAEERLGKPISEAVISVPAYFDDACRTATIDAARIAGLEVQRVLNEPTAAAIAYGLDARQNGTVLVYDLGGGTFDVTVMKISGGQFEVLGTDGDRHLGGYDWDNVAMEWLNEQFRSAGGPSLLDDPAAEQMLRDNAVRAKHTLSGKEETNVFLAAHGFSEKVTLTRAQFDDLTSPLLARTARLVEKAMADAGLGWSGIEKVLLVGGSTRMRQVPEFVTALSGSRPSLEVNPDEVVALGAALQGAITSNRSGSSLPVPIVSAAGERLSNVTVHDVTAHSLGVVAFDDDMRLANSIMIPRGSTIPAMRSEVFGTMSDYQDVWECEVTEGEDQDLTYVRRVATGEIRLPGRYRAGAPMEVSLGYDENATVHVFVRDLVTGELVGELHLARAANLEEIEIQRSRQRLEKTELS